jgi:drug/metabolite transporter (DMT)-like permease
MKIVGIVLIVLGLVGVGYGGISWTHQKKVVDLGPLQVSHDKTESLPIPPIAGAICLIAGALVLAGQARHA